MSAPNPADTEVNVRAPGAPKRLVFCFDGTWNKLDALTPTNVVITAETVLPMAPDGRAQGIFYDEGVGTGPLDHLGGGMFGWGIVDKLGDAYRFLTFNYSPGDEIFVFGFSRGAFTARSFVGMLRNCGIVARSKAGQIGEAIEWYRNRSRSTGPDSLKSHQFRSEVSPFVLVEEGEDEWRQANVPGYVAGSATLLKINYLGVWDTVGALGVPSRYKLLAFLNRKYRFHDTALSPIVAAARHAVAIDERRKDFMPTLWPNIAELNAVAGHQPGDTEALYQEHWFPGVHCGVGGGGDFRGLSDQALVWVWDGAQRAGLALDTDVGSRLFELLPDPHSPLSPFDTDALPFFERLKAAIVNALWMKGDRRGPASIRDVSLSAQRRWKCAPATLPEKVAYRPAPLAKVKHELDALPPIPAPPPPGSYDLHRVVRGDTLRSIAERQLGDAELADEIFSMNRDILEDADHIYPGMPLRIPKLPKAVPMASPAPLPPPP